MNEKLVHFLLQHILDGDLISRIGTDYVSGSRNWSYPKHNELESISGTSPVNGASLYRMPEWKAAYKLAEDIKNSPLNKALE